MKQCAEFVSSLHLYRFRERFLQGEQGVYLGYYKQKSIPEKLVAIIGLATHFISPPSSIACSVCSLYYVGFDIYAFARLLILSACIGICRCEIERLSHAFIKVFTTTVFPGVVQSIKTHILKGVLVPRQFFFLCERPVGHTRSKRLLLNSFTQSRSLLLF